MRTRAMPPTAGSDAWASPDFAAAVPLRKRRSGSCLQRLPTLAAIGEDIDGRLVSTTEISRETLLDRWFWMRRPSHCGASPDRSAIRRSDQRSAGRDPGHPAALRAGIPEAAETPRG